MSYSLRLSIQNIQFPNTYFQTEHHNFELSHKILMIISYDLQIEILFIKMVWRNINLNEETIMNSFKSLFGHYPIVRVKKWYKWNLILQIRHHHLDSGHLYLCYLLSKMQIIGSQHVDQQKLMFHIFHIL